MTVRAVAASLRRCSVASTGNGVQANDSAAQAISARQTRPSDDPSAADNRTPTPLTGLSMAATSRSAAPIGKNRKIARDESASAHGAPSAKTTKPSRCRRREASSAASVEAGREKLAIRTGSHNDPSHYTALQRATLWEFGNSVVAIWIRIG